MYADGVFSEKDANAKVFEKKGRWPISVASVGRQPNAGRVRNNPFVGPLIRRAIVIIRLIRYCIPVFFFSILRCFPSKRPARLIQVKRPPGVHGFRLTCRWAFLSVFGDSTEKPNYKYRYGCLRAFPSYASGVGGAIRYSIGKYSTFFGCIGNICVSSRNPPGTRSGNRGTEGIRRRDHSPNDVGRKLGNPDPAVNNKSRPCIRIDYNWGLRCVIEISCRFYVYTRRIINTKTR